MVSKNVAAVLPRRIKPMLAKLTRHPFDSPEYIYELKWDGMRSLAFIEHGELKLVSRNGRNVTSQFLELANMLEYVGSVGTGFSQNEA